MFRRGQIYYKVNIQAMTSVKNNIQAQ